MESQYKNFSGYILAGGKSSRMGRDKAFLEFRGKTFFGNAVAILKPICDDRIELVVDPNQARVIKKADALLPNVPHIFDAHEGRGPLGGIHAALQDCKTDFAIILACDMPRVSTDFIRKMCAKANESHEFSAVVPRQTDGALQPLAAVYRISDALPKIESMLDKETSVSVKTYLAEIRYRVIESEAGIGERNMFLNINRPEDIEALDQAKNERTT